MSLLKILKYPDPFLRKKCAPVEEIDEELLTLLDDMTETMYAARGVGLAASQVGADKRIVVIDVSPWFRNDGEEEGEGEDESRDAGDAAEAAHAECSHSDECSHCHDEEEYDGPGLIELINPVIVSSEGEAIAEEACLSIPGFSSEVKRKYKIVVEAYNREGDPIEIEAEDLLARVFQHEIDHLDGILFIDRLSRLKRELIKRKIEKEFGKEKKRYAVL
jgi:peptide deformylase